MQTISEIRRLPGPITGREVADIENALLGDYKDKYHPQKGTIFLLPEARDFEKRLKAAKTFDSLNVDSTARTYRFLVPFIIKAEISPGFAFGEGMLTWIHFLSCKWT